MITRPEISDAKEIINLLALAMEDAIYAFGRSDEKGAKELFCELFKRDDVRHSHKNIFVYKKDSQICGAICSYLACDETKFLENETKFIATLGYKVSLEKEAKPNSLYIDCIAVSPKWRKQGIANELINEVFLKAKSLEVDEVSLLVSLQKPKTRAYYEKFGFEFSSKEMLYGDFYDLMSKKIF